MFGILSLVAILANVIGVLLLFRYGMPFRLRTKPSYLVVKQQTSQQRLADQHYDLWSYLGILLILGAALIQVWALWHPIAIPQGSATLPPPYEQSNNVAVETSTRNATWAQVAITALVGAGVIWTAVAQIRRFILADRSKATIEYIARFEGAIHIVPYDDAMSASSALSLASGATLKPQDLAHYKALVAQCINNVFTTDTNRRDYYRYKAAFGIALNYFVVASEYIKKDLMDGALFVNFFQRQVRILHEAVQAVQDVEPTLAETLNSPSFQRLVASARQEDR